MGLIITLFLAVSAVAVVNGGDSTREGAVHLDVKSGGRTPVKDAKTNKEIQAMGRYCVSEYNKGLKEQKVEVEGIIELLDFKEVVSAEKQVVAGVKYFLHIDATTPDGAVKTFDAELLIKPRARDMEMLVFAPTFTQEPPVDSITQSAGT